MEHLSDITFKILHTSILNYYISRAEISGKEADKLIHIRDYIHELYDGYARERKKNIDNNIILLELKQENKDLKDSLKMFENLKHK